MYNEIQGLSSVQLLSRVRLFATPWIAAHQASLTITNSRSSPKLMSIESVMPSSHLILCRSLLLLPPIPPSIRIFSNESTLHTRWPKYWSFKCACFQQIIATQIYLQPSGSQLMEWDLWHVNHRRKLSTLNKILCQYPLLLWSFLSCQLEMYPLLYLYISKVAVWNHEMS